MTYHHSLQFRISLIVFTVLILVESCWFDKNDRLNDSILKQQLIDSLNSLRRIDSIKFENEKLKIQDSILNVLLPNAPSLSQLFKELQKSVSFVRLSSGNSSNVSGSAFFVDGDGLSVSNYHVFDGMKQGLIESWNGKEYRISDILQSNDSMDWIIFKIDNNGDSFVPVQFAKELPEVGDKCYAIGNPLQLKLTLSDGIISAIRDNGKIFQVTNQIEHGSSGGPLFNKWGELIGITTAKLEAINFAIGVLDIKTALFDLNNSPIPINTIADADFFIIPYSAFRIETNAQSEVANLHANGLQVDYLWIPDFSSLSGNPFYLVYYGPFTTESECRDSVKILQNINSLVFGQLVSKSKGRMIIR